MEQKTIETVSMTDFRSDLNKRENGNDTVKISKREVTLFNSANARLILALTADWCFFVFTQDKMPSLIRFQDFC
jgi:hypothetical protein